MSELLWQIQNFTAFPWVSGGLFAEMNSHQIDELCWLKGDYPSSPAASAVATDGIVARVGLPLD